MIWESLVDLVSGRYGIEAVSGPIGITEQIAVTASRYGLFELLYLTVILAMNLGIFNLLPFPALDGGRILFILIGIIRRKPISTNVESYVNFFGFVVMLAFAAFVTLKDIITLFK
jgi:regulator of sigma E protease